ncbi:FixH family protein [Paenibacillus hamazuiensis]|uniref:FixH family protein n=1 Tax=Paenibacillus hamazuiensis TaxID=2936508 RepID=UPI00200D4368|nr:FixH family protein [Paenibacillus hamazuiensis]
MAGNNRFLPMLIVLGGFALAVCACSSSNGAAHSHGGDEPAAVRVQITTVPETIRAGQPVRIEAKVTLGESSIDDAKKVEFEIGEDGQSQGLFTAKHQGQGVYSLDKTFEHKGSYYIIAHVRAKGMHSMPKKQLIVE